MQVGEISTNTNILTLLVVIIVLMMMMIMIKKKTMEQHRQGLEIVFLQVLVCHSVVL